MDSLPEDAGERLEFDRALKIYGSPLKAVAAALAVMHQMAPKQGSYGKMLAIYANEVAKADGEIARLRTPLAPGPARTEREIEAIARAIYSAQHKGLRNCWAWDDPGLDEEHPGRRKSVINQARAAHAALMKVREG